MAKKNRGMETTQVQNSEPWDAIQPDIKYGLKQARKIVKNGPAPFFGPSTHVGMGDETQDALGRIETMAAAPTPGLDAANQQVTATARGDYLGENNPYLAQLYASGADDITNRVRDSYSGMGRYGSSPMNEDLVDSLGGFYASLYAPAYEAERGRQLQAAGMAPGLQEAGYAGADRALGAGMIRDQDAQAQRDAEFGRWAYETQAPKDDLSWYASMISGLGGGYGTTTVQEPPVPFWQRALGFGLKAADVIIPG